jgi:dethiobiotin synthetase
MNNTLLIAGSDTDIGKTVVTSGLLAYWQRHCTGTVGLMKPVQTGVGDLEHYTRLFDLDQSPEQITPLRYGAPLAPPLAAAQEKTWVDLAPVWQPLLTLSQQRQWVLVEALGGLGSPVTAELTVADLAQQWRLPTVLVVPVRLGAIAQAVANVALARQVGVDLRGLILNCPQPCSPEQQENWAPVGLIERLTCQPVLGRFPYVADVSDLDALAAAAAILDLEALLPRAVQPVA